jgi:predicted RNase H-like HicB family nuclease
MNFPDFSARRWGMRGHFLEGGEMTYQVVLEESDEGFAVSVPSLPGCHSQGETEAQAMENIADAIRDYLDAIRERLNPANVREVEV